MKYIFVALFSLSALAAETIVIDSEKITLPDSILKESITLERNVNSPSTVELTIPSHPQKECVKYETQQVYGEDASCGSYTVPECRTESFDCENRVRCTMPTELFGCQREEWYQVCQYRPVCTDRTRYVSCYHEAKVCVEYKEVPVEAKKATLTFNLKRRQQRKTHKIHLTLNDFNGFNVRSSELMTNYDFMRNVWVLKK